MAALQEHLPARVGPFEIVGVLGEGGMGIVYSARMPGSRTRVALKTVTVVDEGLLSSMRREIHALGRLSHPGVVRVLSSGVEGGRPWYAMELLEGTTLAALRDAIAGESGVGKTYLAMEAARANPGLEVVSGTCALAGTLQHGPGGQPLHPFAAVLQLITDRCTTLGRAATDELLSARGKILAEHEPSLAGLPGLDAYPDPPPLHGAARRDRLLAALADTLAALGGGSRSCSCSTTCSGPTTCRCAS